MCHGDNGNENNHHVFCAYCMPGSRLVTCFMKLYLNRKLFHCVCQHKKIYFEAHNPKKRLFGSGMTPQISKPISLIFELFPLVLHKCFGLAPSPLCCLPVSFPFILTDEKA